MDLVKCESYELIGPILQEDNGGKYGTNFLKLSLDPTNLFSSNRWIVWIGNP